MKTLKKIQLYQQDRLSAIGICILILFMISSCGKKTESNEITEESTHTHSDDIEKVTNLQITSRQYKTADIELGNVQEAGLTQLLKASGTLDVPPGNIAEVSPYIGGVVRSINVVQGDHVTKGQSLVTLQHPDYIILQENYITLQNELDYLEKEYIRQSKLNEEKVNASKTLQLAESNFNTAKSKLASLEGQLTMLNISTASLDEGIISQSVSLRAPMNGYVTHIHTNLGTFAEPNKPLLDIVDNNKIQVNLEIFESDIDKIKIGQKFTARLPNRNNTGIEGTITKIIRNIENITKSVSVIGKLNNTEGIELIPGVFVNAEINVETNSVFAVPIAAIVRSGKNQFVFIVDKELISKPPEHGKDPYSIKDASGNVVPLAYRMIEVKTGVEDKGLIEIFPHEEITPEDQIVVRGAYYLISALKSGETVGCCAPAEEEKKEK